ncbi:reverse transcriptase domain-containing protein [Peribacillus simplex]|uniref:reverse transcriptase domain-containing protein n=1 Tax=Peribacillus simplex TaxID=1478 RepID=UPI000BA54262|nr:reverse transcriptase domain-containing protein [Peribacillus simplex]PAK42646.1 reverse transcriptase [Peribacillus simplex]
MNQSNRLQLHNLPSSSQIDIKKYRSKGYLHFDKRIKIEHVYHKIQDQNWVAKHAFLPFIHYKIKLNKYTVLPGITSKEMRLNKDQSSIKFRKPKERMIYYASHLDSYIYKYYGEQLNEAYDKYAKDKGIDEIAIAYRNKKSGENNIDFAKEVFKFILQQENAVIIALDFTKFFDTINHKTLKENIKTVLGAEELPVDFYKVFKSITNFSFINKAAIDEFLIGKYGRKKLKKFKKQGDIQRIMNPSEFREFKKEQIKIHNQPFGIPQGSGMSAVCSNVHLINFDVDLKTWAETKDGFYRRYCDDLILVIPYGKDQKPVVEDLIDQVYEIIRKYDDLKVQEEKTEIRIFEDGQIKTLDNEFDKIDYLGFLLDGKTVKIREKSVFKYYSRAYRKAKISKERTIVRGVKTYRWKLYKLYSHLGYDYKGYGNFISYALQAHEKMLELPVDVQIKNQIKRHWNKIQNRLK